MLQCLRISRCIREPEGISQPDWASVLVYNARFEGMETLGNASFVALSILLPYFTPRLWRPPSVRSRSCTLAENASRNSQDQRIAERHRDQVLIGDNDTYNRTPFRNEAEIETVVQKYAEYLFGSRIVYLPKAKVKTLGGWGSIPDGFVIDVQGEEWFIVEAERATHSTWGHIAPQISRQLAAVESASTGQRVAQLAVEAYRDNSSIRDTFRDLGIAELDVAGKLNSILSKPPTIAIPIDGVPRDLEQWARTLRNTVKIWVIEKYVSSSDSTKVLYSLPEDDAPTITTRSVGGQSITTRATGALPFQDLVDGELLHEGQKLTLRYRQQNFEGIVRKDGIEVDERTMSPSAAAVACMRKLDNNARSANGWVLWRTEEGAYLSDLREKAQARSNYADRQDAETSLADAV